MIQPSCKTGSSRAQQWAIHAAAPGNPSYGVQEDGRFGEDQERLRSLEDGGGRGRSLRIISSHSVTVDRKAFAILSAYSVRKNAKSANAAGS